MGKLWYVRGVLSRPCHHIPFAPFPASLLLLLSAFLLHPQDVKFFLHNHLRFNILYNRDAATDLSRVVGFEVEAFSVKHEYDKPWDAKNPTMTTCNPARMIAVSHSLPPQPVEEGAEVVFTYDVKWSVSVSPRRLIRRME